MQTHRISDPIFLELEQKVLEKFGALPTVTAKDPTKYFDTLIESIISQQLSVKVADTIYTRVLAQLGEITPQTVLAADIEQLRALGLSGAKAQYVQNLATAWTDDSIEYRNWQSASDAEIIAQLTQVKGIGQWTAEMFLLSALARPDVFSAGDYGLRAAIARAYAIPLTEKPRVFAAHAEQWSPHRSYASRILWRSLEL